MGESPLFRGVFSCFEGPLRIGITDSSPELKFSMNCLTVNVPSILRFVDEEEGITNGVGGGLFLIES